MNEKTQTVTDSEDRSKLNVMVRVKLLENESRETREAITDMVQTFGEAMGILQRELRVCRETLSAHVELTTGNEEVVKKVEENRQKRAEEIVRNEETALAQGVEKGIVVPLEVVEPGCIVVGKEVDKDGNPVTTGSQYPAPTGRHQRYLNGYNQEIQDTLLGQKVGFKLTTPGGTEFEILGIYREGVAPAEKLDEAEKIEEVAKVEAAVEQDNVIPLRQPSESFAKDDGIIE